MKVTKNQLKRIIKEELKAIMKEGTWTPVEQTPEEKAAHAEMFAGAQSGTMSDEEWKANREKRRALRKQRKAQPAAAPAQAQPAAAPAQAQPAAAPAQAQPAAGTSQVAAELAKKLKPYFPPATGMATAVITALVKAPDEAAARETFPSQFEEKLIRAWGFIKKQIKHEQRDNPDLKETDVYIAMARDEGWTDEYIRKIAGGAG